VTPTRQLTARIVRGDPEAFTALYEAWFDRCFALARSFTRRDEAFCLDVVQDVMLRVVKSLKPLDSEAALAAWLCRAVQSTAIDRLRAHARSARREAAVAASRPELQHGLEPSLQAQDQERARWLEARIAELPEAEQALWTARFVEGRTLDQAGAAAGMSGDAAHGRLWRLVDRLRRMANEVFS
jgi:RNA polymerase sigma-70 factor (ECF subfamily)